MSLMVMNKLGTSLSIAAVLLTICLLVYHDFEGEFVSFTIRAISLFIILFLLLYVFLVLWNFSVIHFFHRTVVPHVKHYCTLLVELANFKHFEV